MESCLVVLLIIGAVISLIGFLIEMSASISSSYFPEEFSNLTNSKINKFGKINTGLSIACAATVFSVVVVLLIYEGTGYFVSLIWCFPIGGTWFVYSILLAVGTSPKTTSKNVEYMRSNISVYYMIDEPAMYYYRYYNISDVIELEKKVNRDITQKSSHLYKLFIAGIVISAPYSIPLVIVPAIVLALCLLLLGGAGSND